jgi:hypothetical protein
MECGERLTHWEKVYDILKRWEMLKDVLVE